MTVSEEMLQAGLKAWLDAGNLEAYIHFDELEAIYLAMKAAEPLQQGDEVERLRDVLEPFAKLGERLGRLEGGVVEVCAPHPDNPSSRIEPFPTVHFDRVRAALVRSKLTIREVPRKSFVIEDEPTSYADFQQRRGMLPDLMYALAPIRDTVAGYDDKPGDTKLYFTLDELRDMAKAITAIGSQSIEGERRTECAVHDWHYSGTDYHGSHKGEDAYKCHRCGKYEYRG